MIRAIAAIDSKRGMADDHGIPWQGKVPSDVKHFREYTQDSIVLMGYGTYVEFDKPLSSRRNLVASSKSEKLREGFELVNDARAFLRSANEDVWVIGGPGLFAATLDLIDELYITKLEGDFNCSKFFPEYEDKFTLVKQSDPISENGITFRFTLYKRK